MHDYEELPTKQDAEKQERGVHVCQKLPTFMTGACAEEATLKPNQLEEVVGGDNTIEGLQVEELSLCSG